jgi:hypothetical protein
MSILFKLSAILALGVVLASVTCVAQDTAQLASERTKLAERVEEKLNRADIGSKSWSTAYHSCATVSILFPAIAALLVKMQEPKKQKRRDNIVAILAAVAALTATLNTTLKFNQKWIANRATRATLDTLKTDMTDPALNTDEIRKRLNEAMTRHEQMLTK